MESVNKTTALCLCIIISLLNSCGPKYFVEKSDNEYYKTFQINFDSTIFDKFEFKLRPYHYYKNTKETTSLLSDSTSFIKDNILFHVAADRDILGHNTDHFINKSWFEMELLIENPTHDDLMKEGSIVYIKSSSGKTVNNQEQIKVAHIFAGTVGPKVPLTNGNNQVQLIYITDMKKVLNNKIKDKFKNKKTLAFAVKRLDDKVKVYAVIDIDFKKRSDKSVIYDLTEIFGSELWMNKIENQDQ